MIKIIERLVFISFLIIASWQDIKSRSIAVWVYGLFGSIGWFLRLCGTERTDWKSLGGGIVICLFLLMLNKVTEVGVVDGDGYFFIVTSIFLGVWKNIVLFLGGVLFCGLFSMGIIVWSVGNRVSVRKKTIPFLPFLMPVGICLAIF